MPARQGGAQSNPAREKTPPFNPHPMRTFRRADKDYRTSTNPPAKDDFPYPFSSLQDKFAHLRPPEAEDHAAFVEDRLYRFVRLIACPPPGTSLRSRH